MTPKTGYHAHGRYEIRTLAGLKNVRGRALRGAQILADATATSEAEVVARLRLRLDEMDNAERRDWEGRVPDAAHFAAALGAVGGAITPKQRQLLRTLYEAPERTMSMALLAKAVGSRSHATANLHLGKLGRLVAEQLAWTPTAEAKNAEYVPALATSDGAADGGGTPWTMRPELVAAIGSMDPAFLHG